MKFTPKTLIGNINVSKSHPLKEFFWLTGGLLLLLGFLFLLLGLMTDLAVTRIPPDIESWLGEKALTQFTVDKDAALQTKLDSIISVLPADSPLHQYTFTIYSQQTDEINAIALPGGNVIVFSGLLEQVESENELAMILAHELGHFAHRDHLRGLGRGLGLTVATTLLFGYDNAASNIISNTMLTYQVRYSQQQEEEADLFGLDLLVRRFDHAGGATDFFRRLGKDTAAYSDHLLASHPHPEKRVETIEQRIAERSYQVEPTIPFSHKREKSD